MLIKSVASGGMMLAFVPACRLPTVTTPIWNGFTSRETMPCRRITIEDASSTGSTPRWGIEPWEPLPKTFTRKHAPVDSIGPAVVADLAGRRHGEHVLAQGHVRLGDLVDQPILHHGVGAPAGLLAGLEQREVPAQPSRCCASKEAAPSAAVMCMSWPHAGTTGTVLPSASVAVLVDA